MNNKLNVLLLFKFFLVVLLIWVLYKLNYFYFYFKLVAKALILI